MSLVNVSLVGNVVKTPELMSFPSGRVKTTLVIAVDRLPRESNGTDNSDFYRVETWGKLAELANKYLQKGNQVGACGRLVLDRWTDKQGNLRVTPVIEANQLTLPTRLKLVSNNAHNLPEDTLPAAASNTP